MVLSLAATAMPLGLRTVAANPIRPWEAYTPAPDLAAGDVIIADSDARSLIHLKPNPKTSGGAEAAQTAISVADELVRPAGVAAGPDGTLYVADMGSPDGNDGKVVRVDPQTGTQTVIASNDKYFVNPTDLVYVERPGDSPDLLYVVDPDGRGPLKADGSRGTLGYGSVVRITLDEAAGNPQTLVTSGATLDDSGKRVLDKPWGVTADLAGRLYVIDPGTGSAADKVVMVDPRPVPDGEAVVETFATHPAFRTARGIAYDHTRDQLVITDDDAYDNRQAIFTVDVPSRTVTVLTQLGTDFSLDFGTIVGLAIEDSGNILVVDADGNDDNGSVFRVVRNQGNVSFQSIARANLFRHPMRPAVMPNRAPRGLARSYTVVGTTPTIVTLPAIDDDRWDAPRCVIVTRPATAMGTFSENGCVPTFTPAVNGVATFTYKVNDGKADSPTYLVAIATSGIAENAAPFGAAAAFAVPGSGVSTFRLAAGDPDPGDSVSCVVTTAPALGALVPDSADGCSLRYTPVAAGTQTFKYRVSDGRLSSETYTVTLTISPVNRAPVGADQAIAVTGPATVPLTLTAFDPDGDPVTCEIVTPPTSGTFTRADDTACSGDYLPGAEGTDTFTYRVADGTVASESYTVTLEVSGVTVDGAPTGADQSVAITGSTATTVTLAAADPDGDAFSCAIVLAPASGHLVHDDGACVVTFTPVADGTVSLAYRVTDVGGLVSPTYTVTIDVTGVAPGGPDVAPFGSVDDLVERQFRDFAGRAPTATERSTWSARIAAGTASADDLVVRLSRATSRDGLRWVTRAYLANLGRGPDQAGMTYWVAQLDAGRSPESVSRFFSASKEFRAQYGTLTDTAFVNRIYSDVLQRTPESSTVVQYWVGRLEAGWSRGRVMLVFTESEEYRGKPSTAARCDLVSLYLGMLGRVPEPGPAGELDVGAGRLVERSASLAEISREIRTGAAYAARIP